MLRSSPGSSNDNASDLDLVDAHHHLWRYDRDAFGWINEEMSVLRRDFVPADLQTAMEQASITGSLAVQARQTIDETRWLLDCSDQFAAIRGVVGWLPLASPHFTETLREFRERAALKGLRHVVQDEPDDFILDPAFNQGIAALLDTGLVYEILVYPRQLKPALAFVKQHPAQRFVLDHAGKPDIRGRGWDEWAEGISRLAECPNVVCKLSGLVTEANWSTWTLDDLTPYLDFSLALFGAERLMAGSDWPVCLVAATYQQWWSTVKQWVEPLRVHQRRAILAGTATRTYNLTS